MKISEIKSCIAGSELKKAKPAEGSPGEFSRLLAEESGKTGEAIGGVGSGMEPVALPSAGSFLPAGLGKDFSGGYLKVDRDLEGCINRLEKLQLALQNPKGDLKSIEAAINDLNVSAVGLQESVADLPEKHLLRRMADELSILAHVESIKYRRGDYL
jgi:hypothetical protein